MYYSIVSVIVNIKMIFLTFIVIFLFFRDI
nr:MAG TPA: hypothetical protein [Caudoviricetes sp.]